MASIVEDGENIEVNLGPPPPAPSADSPTGNDCGDVVLGSVEETLSSPPPEETPPLSKDSSDTTATISAVTSPKRRLTFPFRQTKTTTAVTPEAQPPAAELEQASDSPIVAVPVTPSLETNVETKAEEEEEEEEGGRMFFTRRGEKLESNLFQEAEPELLQSDSEDERSLVEAETAESLLGSALRMAEEGTGESFLSLSRAPRNDAIELGRRVSTFSDIRAVVGRSPSLLSDDGSVHTWGSVATDTTFIKIEQVDPTTITQETWNQIIGETMADEPELENVLLDDGDEPSPISSDPAPKSPSRKGRGVVAPVVTREAPPGAVPDRKWDKLRNTLEAQERGASVGYETQLDPNEMKRRKSKENPQRMKRLGKGLQSLVCTQRTSKPKAPKARWGRAAAKPFDVNIQVEDLSKKLEDRDLNACASEDPTLGSSDDHGKSHDLSDKKLADQELNASLDSTVGSHDDESSIQDLEEAESMEVVYLVSETDENVGDTLPPFPTKLVGKYI